MSKTYTANDGRTTFDARNGNESATALSTFAAAADLTNTTETLAKLAAEAGDAQAIIVPVAMGTNAHTTVKKALAKTKVGAHVIFTSKSGTVAAKFLPPKAEKPHKGKKGHGGNKPKASGKTLDLGRGFAINLPSNWEQMTPPERARYRNDAMKAQSKPRRAER